MDDRGTDAKCLMIREGAFVLTGTPPLHLAAPPILLKVSLFVQLFDKLIRVKLNPRGGWSVFFQWIVPSAPKEAVRHLLALPPLIQGEQVAGDHNAKGKSFTGER